MDVFKISQIFSGENKGRKTTTLKETQADQTFQHY